LFTHHLCDDLYIDNETLQEVIEGLNHSKDNSYKYDFSIIESDVLGNIYEQYLGNILKSTPKRAKLKESKTHRKEQGIYYTPSYIVDYIVKNTVGEYIRTHTPEEIKKVKILDPACGSGSFLIKAYKELENYWKQNSDFAQLTLDSEEFYSKKVEILKNNIFGVDLDPKAVEIAQLNLLLQISEKGEKLPLLQNNIKVGNSLIDDPSITDKAFKWEEEFPEIMKEGGFDIIIGNPPYSNIKSEDVLKNLSYFKNLSNGVVNSATLFLKKSLDLLKKNGSLGFIIPKSFTYVKSWRPIRKIIYENSQLLKLIDVSKAFKDVLLEQVIIIIEKKEPNPNETVSLISEFYTPSQSLTKISYGEIIKNDMITFQSNSLVMSIYNKLNTDVIFLGEISKNFRGINAQKFVSKKSKDGERILCGKEIQRYYIDNNCNYFINTNYISKIKKAKKLKIPKIMVQNIIAHIRDHIKITATYDSEGLLDLDTVNNILVEDPNFDPKYILVLLNSDLISFYAYNFIYSKAIRTMHFDRNYSDKIPIKKVSKDIQEYFSNKVDILLNLYSEYLSETKLSDRTIKLKQQIETIEKELNDKVYEIYGITDDERNLIEMNSK
jgi:type I restriction-modification system DNA methylase subunit